MDKLNGLANTSRGKRAEEDFEGQLFGIFNLYHC